jgi:hypothetical protein
VRGWPILRSGVERRSLSISAFWAARRASIAGSTVATAVEVSSPLATAVDLLMVMPPSRSVVYVWAERDVRAT